MKKMMCAMCMMMRGMMMSRCGILSERNMDLAA